jgi:hypothetical protein
VERSTVGSFRIDHGRAQRHRRRHNRTRPARSQLGHFTANPAWMRVGSGEKRGEFGGNPDRTWLVSRKQQVRIVFALDSTDRFFSSTARNRNKLPLTLAANVNSRSSDRKVLSSMAVLITSSSRSSLRKRYSVTPSQIRNNCLTLTQRREWTDFH